MSDNGQLSLFNSLDICRMCDEPFDNNRDFCSEDCEVEAKKACHWLEMAAFEFSPWKHIVYVIEVDGFFKIGYTQSFKKRMMEIKISSPHPINVIYKFHTNYGLEIEKILQESFEDKRVSGEWFDLDREDLYDIYISLSIFEDQRKFEYKELQLPELEEDLTIETFSNSPRYKDNGR
jgi:hypothetical protein